MNGLITLFVRRPVTVIMILSALVIAAIFSLFNLPVNRLPEISVPRVTVETVYPGMAANEVRSLVTIPLEDGLSPIKGLEKIRSVSRDNRSLISMDFRWGTDPMAAAVLVREAVDAVYPSLPEGVRKPTVNSGDSANEPHAIIAVRSHNGNPSFARKLAEYELRARFRKIDGAGSVVLVGGETAEERLFLDVQRLAALGLSPHEFAGVLAQETADIPAGNAKEGNLELVVVSSGRPNSVYELSKIVLPVADGTLTVSDAGLLAPSTARRESAFVYDGKEAVALEIYRRPGSDPLRLSRDIKKTVNEAAAAFSRDAVIEIVIDSSPSLISGITSLLISAALAIAAVVTILFIFIRNFKYSLLASFSIPLSAAAGICILSAFGKSLNSMSLGGLAMGIGLVSDISIIVLDLLHRSFGQKDTVPEPQETGNKVSSIAGSSIASTLTTIVVFFPIILLPGMLGSLFGDIALTLVTSVATGWFYAQFCLPSMYRFMLKTGDTKKKFVFTNGSLVNRINIDRKYARSLLLIFHHPGKFFGVAILVILLGVISLFARPVVFVNPDEAEEVHISVVSPPGTFMESISVVGMKLTRNISGLPFVKTVFGKAGAEQEDTGRRADIDYIREDLILRCVLNKNIKPEKALAEINAYMAETHNDLSFSVYLPKDKTETLLGLSAEHTFVIKAKDRDELEEKTDLVKDIFNNANIPVKFRPQGLRPELRLYPNREAAAFLAIPAAQIAETLYVLNEGVVASTLEIEGQPLDVRVMGYSAASGDSIRNLEHIPLKTPQGKTVYLGSLGRIERKEAEAALARLDRSDVLYADILSDKKLPAEINKSAARADESVFSLYKNSLVLYVLLVLILLYMTMGAQFESFLLPLILMLSIPFSLAGAGPALLLSGSKIDSGAVLGLTALFGLVVNNSLILFEISEENICAGLSPAAAIYRGASERLQAILITTATTVFALLPLVISPMANSQKSMAAAMLGGLIASTLLSLFAIPPVLLCFFKWKFRLTNCAVQKEAK
ncbi:MAG: efflux RND transporter permease subunit [Treponema sp.]|jgi:multidrug efflux pump subunit AcrB|nr:efflux RND transporter permease subunit [Treponema sp.]